MRALGRRHAECRTRRADRAKAAGKGFADPERLPDAVNGYGGTYNAFIVPDERTLPRLAEMSATPQNGNSDIYWVSASLLDTMRIPGGDTKPPSPANNGV